MRKYPDRLGKNNKTFIGCFLNSYQICRWLGLPPRPISAPNERYIWHKARECPISVKYKSIVVLNYYKLEMKVWEMKITMYHFVSCFINVTDLSVDVACQVPRYVPPCLSVNFLFASPLTFVYTLIIGLLLTWYLKKYDYYIWISKWQKCKQKNGLMYDVGKWRKPSFTASTTGPRMLFDAKPWLKSTCCRFEFHLRKKNQGAENAFSAVWSLRSPDQRNLTCVPNWIQEKCLSNVCWLYQLKWLFFQICQSWIDKISWDDGCHAWGRSRLLYPERLVIRLISYNVPSIACVINCQSIFVNNLDLSNSLLESGLPCFDFICLSPVGLFCECCRMSLLWFAVNRHLT